MDVLGKEGNASKYFCTTAEMSYGVVTLSAKYQNIKQGRATLLQLVKPTQNQ